VPETPDRMGASRATAPAELAAMVVHTVAVVGERPESGVLDPRLHTLFDNWPDRTANGSQ